MSKKRVLVVLFFILNSMLIPMKSVFAFLGTGCDREINFFNKFICEHFLLALVLNILAWVIFFAATIYVLIYIIKKIRNKKTKIFNKKLLTYLIVIIVVVWLLFILISGF